MCCGCPWGCTSIESFRHRESGPCHHLKQAAFVGLNDGGLLSAVASSNCSVMPPKLNHYQNHDEAADASAIKIVQETQRFLS